MVFINGFNSIPMVSFILHSVSVTGTICIHRLKGRGEVVVANLMHLQGSFSTICNTIFPTGGTSIDNVSASKLKFFTQSCGRLSFTFSKLLRSESFSKTAFCEAGITFTALSNLVIIQWSLKDKKNYPDSNYPNGSFVIIYHYVK